MWGYARLIDCIGINPIDNAGLNIYSKCQVGAFNYAMVRVYGGSFTQTTNDPPWLAGEGGILAISPSTIVTKPSATPLVNIESSGGGAGGPDGIVVNLNPGDTTVPTITSSGAISINENKLGIFPITTSETAQLRVVGGVDAASFSTFGNQLRLARQDYEDAANPTHQRQCVVQVIDTNGNVSSTQTITVTIGNVDDDPISPAQLFGAGQATDGVWLDTSVIGSMWQDVGATIPAEVGQPVARIDDLSGYGHHALQPDPARQGILQSEGGVNWIDLNGTSTVYAVGSANSLRFAKTTQVIAIRRMPTTVNTGDEIARAWAAMPRAATAVGGNAAYSMAAIGGASLRCVYGGTALNLSGNGGNLKRDLTFSLVTETGSLRSYVAANKLGDPASSYAVTGTAVATLNYPIATIQHRLGVEGNNTDFANGRFYAYVLTNRTEIEEYRFRIERQLASQIGVTL